MTFVIEHFGFNTGEARFRGSEGNDDYCAVQSRTWAVDIWDAGYQDVLYERTERTQGGTTLTIMGFGACQAAWIFDEERMVCKGLDQRRSL